MKKFYSFNWVAETCLDFSAPTPSCPGSRMRILTGSSLNDLLVESRLLPQVSHVLSGSQIRVGGTGEELLLCVRVTLNGIHFQTIRTSEHVVFVLLVSFKIHSYGLQHFHIFLKIILASDKFKVRRYVCILKVFMSYFL